MKNEDKLIEDLIIEESGENHSFEGQTVTEVLKNIKKQYTKY